MFEKTKAFCDSFLELGVPGFDLAVYQDGKPVGAVTRKEKGNITPSRFDIAFSYECL